MKVGILGSSGIIGQHYLKLLQNHPRFDLTFLGTRNTLEEGIGTCDLIFSALPSEVSASIDPLYAKAGAAVISHGATHRLDPAIPLIIPEINAHHLALVKKPGFIVAKPNCAIQSFMLPLHALRPFAIEKIAVTNLQAISGAGKEAPSLEDNLLPDIPNEAEKIEFEPRKIWGEMLGSKIVPASLSISAHCIRVPLTHGHTSCVKVKFTTPPTLAEIQKLWAQTPNLIYRAQGNRPQPQLDRDAQEGMAVTVGQLRRCPLFDVRFVGLSHNVVRGGAGGGLAIAHLLEKEGYLG